MLTPHWVEASLVVLFVFLLGSGIFERSNLPRVEPLGEKY